MLGLKSQFFTAVLNHHWWKSLQSGIHWRCWRPSQTLSRLLRNSICSIIHALLQLLPYHASQLIHLIHRVILLPFIYPIYLIPLHFSTRKGLLEIKRIIFLWVIWRSFPKLRVLHLRRSCASSDWAEYQILLRTRLFQVDHFILI